MFGGLKSLFRFGRLTEEDFRREQERILTKIPVPVFWLFGKTGSGKTSIVRYLTGAADAEIGLGFRPQTRFSRQYDFPDAGHPVARFLDTRGLGESRYDPAEDIAEFDRSAHMVLVTARVMDHALAGVVEPLRAIRKAKPDRPIVLALTCLHEAHPGEQHPEPDPFTQSLLPDGISESLRRSIERQRERFEGLADHVVPIDLTRTEEGFDEPDFGGERLKQTLLDVLPAAYRRTLRDFDEAMRPLKDLNERRATPYIIGYSSMAATAAAVPVPWVDIPVVMAIQSHLVYKLATLYGQEVRTSVVSQMVGAAGG
ncbi:MAG: GTPase family protein, partial [Planctomycetaceae bacterium]